MWYTMHEGIYRIKDINREERERHVGYSGMNELVQCASSYKCKGRDADIDCSKAGSDRDGG